ncbi:DUF6046 domain-containing protein [Pseudotamlana carrageenivorans]|uniref:DUF6046 domain-containing protein n=1 Tax=Pseudotamlana carrageenivorans TaxID=2069432 RepID=A0A2I7SF03_9FLAO|nr:DUF6046 domain-containing protein [Tamlana carrageenivorans]AUS04483.1 hypothetical protein C1A40_02900 [Tamlana carrageenivorans]
MELNKQDIIFSSLVGVHRNERFKVVQNQLSKNVLPPIPFLGFKNKEALAESNASVLSEHWQADTPRAEGDQFFPFSFVGSDGQKYLLPYEPMITIAGKNSIVRRNVAKAKTVNGQLISGSIKERWTQGDYEITITGVLIGSLLTGDMEDCFPISDFEKLRDFMIAPRRIKVYCEPLRILGVDYIVIEDFSFPFTKGENVQAYEIKAYSDFDYKLLLELDD